MKANAGNKFGEEPDAGGDARPPASPEGAVSDPFADDLFAARPAHTGKDAADTRADRRGAEAPRPDAVPWHSRLTRLTAEQARLSTELAALSPAVADRLVGACERALARYADVAPEDVSLALVGLREGVLSRAGGEAPPGLRVTLAVEPQGAPFSVEMDADFCAALVDRMAGGAGAAPDSLRALTGVERAVLEFFWLALCREVHAELGEPLFRLLALKDLPPAGSGSDNARGRDAADALSYGLSLTARVAASRTVGLARCRVPAATLTALAAADNPLLARARAVTRREKVARLKRVAPELTLRLHVGETGVEVAELARLERDDVLVIEKQHAGLRGGSFAGRLRLLAGDGPGAAIVGTAAEPPRDGAPDSQGAGAGALEEEPLSLFVEEIFGGGGAGVTERMMMAGDETDDGAAGEGVTPIDGLVLTVHVELAARRISLESLAGLRVGQVLGLDCKATDPVDLIAEGRRIARGELVDIEGQLGVRVTQLFG